MLDHIPTNPGSHPDEHAGPSAFRGVTRILRDGGAMQGWEVAESILERGSEVHRGAHLLDTATRFRWTTLAPEHRGFVRAWRRFKIDFEVHIIASELSVSNEAYQIRGRLDRIVTFGDDGQLCVLELKSGKVMPFTALQLAAYGWLYDPKLLFRRFGLQLNADGTYVPPVEYSRRTYMRDVHDFLSLARAAHVRQRLAL